MVDCLVSFSFLACGITLMLKFASWTHGPLWHSRIIMLNILFSQKMLVWLPAITVDNKIIMLSTFRSRLF